jgi:Fe2+ or Zn2+ uptake regulation protein
MTNIDSLFVDTLREHGYSLTKPRRILFTQLRQRDTITMHELIDACTDTLDRATVYRTVLLFEQIGIVQRIQIGWKYQLELSDRFSDHHHHAICMRCGKVLALPENPEFERQLTTLTAAHHFTALAHQLEIRGLCSSCRTT